MMDVRGMQKTGKFSDSLGSEPLLFCLQVLEHPAPLGYERMVVGIYQMPAPMKDRCKSGLITPGACDKWGRGHLSICPP